MKPFIRLRQETAGRVYFVKFDDGEAHDVSETPDGLECDCEGFKFKHDCRHVRAAAELLRDSDKVVAEIRRRKEAA
jgi:hypothetical protein